MLQSRHVGRLGGVPRMMAALLAFVLLASAGGALAQTVGEGPAFNNPRGMSRDAAGDLLVADFGNGNIYRVDGTSGERTILSDNRDAGQGPALSQPAGIVVLPDGRIFVSDLGLSAVVGIDPVTGARTPLTSLDPEQQVLLAPFGIATGKIRGRQMLVVADTGSTEDGAVVGPVLVDPDSGAEQRIDAPDGNAIAFNDPRAIAVVANPSEFRGNSGYRFFRGRQGALAPGTILLANFGGGEVIAVNPASGERSIVSANGDESSPGVGEGPLLGSVSDMAISRDGRRLIAVDLGNDAIVEIDPRSGDRTVLSTSAEPQVGSGDDFRSPHGIEQVENGFMISDFGVPGLILVAGDGGRSLFSASPVAGFVSIRALTILADGSISAADFGGNRIFSVDPDSGVRTVVSGSDASGGTIGTGQPFNGPVATVELDAGTLAVAQFQAPSGILAVDKATGNRTPLTGFGIGSGPEVAARGFTLDPNDGNRILATSFNEDAIIAVDVATGNRSFVSKAGTVGEGPGFNNPLGISVDPADGTIFVSDLGALAVYRVTPAGDRAILSANAGVGSGPGFASPFGIAVIDGELFVADNTGLFRIDRTTGDRELLSPGGVLFSAARRDADSLFVANFGAVQGIEIVDKATGERSILSNADVP